VLPSLWLAPFIVASDAEITRKNPDWLLRDRSGQPIRAGWRPEWGGWLHVLDFYNPGVRDYLSGVFHVAVEQWQIAWLQLDYLYAVCLAPPPDKTRGQVLHEALEFLQSLCGTTKMVLSRVPLGSAMPIAAACRFSNDADTTWTDRRATYLHYRERTGALEALRSLISRWHFCKLESGIDTGAFSLASGADKLSPVQQNTVLTINVLLGNYISTADAIQAYTPEQTTELLSVLDLRGSRVVSINMVQPDVFQLVFEQSKTKGVAWCNLNKRPVQVLRTQSEWLELNAFETIILY
jgi:alpha-galactosidase